MPVTVGNFRTCKACGVGSIKISPAMGFFYDCPNRHKTPATADEWTMAILIWKAKQ